MRENSMASPSSNTRWTSIEITLFPRRIEPSNLSPLPRGEKRVAEMVDLRIALAPQERSHKRSRRGERRRRRRAVLPTMISLMLGRSPRPTRTPVQDPLENDEVPGILMRRLERNERLLRRHRHERLPQHFREPDSTQTRSPRVGMWSIHPSF
ncbi:hypothetical protein DFH11DRAFT_1621538 [Phellopilus nigrolimitatus]|nr:hypothetical protein DFH11DRAFT_1621538 [Phellopilus nigrolimitatus]